MLEGEENGEMKEKREGGYGVIIILKIIVKKFLRKYFKAVKGAKLQIYLDRLKAYFPLITALIVSYSVTIF